MDFFELAYRRINNQLETRDYIDWADELLMIGSNSFSIAELASYTWEKDPDAREVEFLFHSCVTECGFSLPSNWEEAFFAYLMAICNSVIGGTLAPHDCLYALLTLSDDNDDPYICWVWIDLARDISRHMEYIVFNDALNLENSDESIRKTAYQFIALCKMDLPAKFPLVWCCKDCGEVSSDTTYTETNARPCPACKSIFSLKNMRFFKNREDYVFNQQCFT